MLGPRAPRWRQSVLLAWIAAGCPDLVRQQTAGSGIGEVQSGVMRDDPQNGVVTAEIECTAGGMERGKNEKRGSG
ncbi:MAG: hypothetical protein ACK5YE_11975 [Planctomyces sp.]